MAKSQELRENRAKLVSQARLLIDAAEGAERELTPEETEQWNSLMGEADKLKEAADSAERSEYQAQVEAELRTSVRKVAPFKPADHHQFDNQRRNALRAWLLAGSGQGVTSEMMHAASHCGINLSARSLTIQLPTRAQREQRAMSVGTTTAGGFTVAPEFYDTLLENIVSWGGMMQSGAQLIQTASGANLPFTVGTDNNVGEIVAELATVTEQDPVFSTINLAAFKYSSKAVKVSMELLQDSAFDLESWLAKILAERIGKILNQHLSTGTGSGQPQGIHTGIATGATGAITWPKLVELYSSIDPAYLGNAKWMFDPTVLSTFMTMTDGNDRPLWVPDLIGGNPGRLLGHEYTLNKDLPDSTVLFGDFRNAYVIREVMSIDLHRLDELYALQGAVGFVAFARYGGGVVNASAVKKLVPAA